MLFTGPNGSNIDPTANRGPLLVNVSAVMVALSCIAVFLRFLGRRLSKTPLLLDDMLIVIALPFTWATAANTIYGVVHNGLGQHLQFSDILRSSSFLLALYIFVISYTLALSLIKFSILSFLYRIFHVPNFKLPVLVTAGIILLSSIASLLAAIFSCNPIYGFWTIDIPSTCIDPYSFYYGQAVPSIITDILLLLLPLPLIWKLQITKAQKWALSGTFLVGGFVTICSIIRLVRLVQTEVETEDTIDFTWNLVDPALWSTVELHIGVCCACLPSTWSLVKYVLDKPHYSFRNSPALSQSWPGTIGITKNTSISSERKSMILAYENATSPHPGSFVYAGSESLDCSTLASSRPIFSPTLPERLTLGSQFAREKYSPLLPSEDEPELPSGGWQERGKRKFREERDVERADDRFEPQRRPPPPPPPPLLEKDKKWTGFNAPAPPRPAVERF